MEIAYDKFKSNPLLYILFLPLVATVSLFLLLNSSHKSQLAEKDQQITEYKRTIIKMDAKQDKIDSINHRLYELLGVKQVIDSLKK